MTWDGDRVQDGGSLPKGGGSRHVHDFTNKTDSDEVSTKTALQNAFCEEQLRLKAVAVCRGSFGAHFTRWTRCRKTISVHRWT